MQIIVRDELIRDIMNELQMKKMIYLEAPCGRGKTVILRQLEEKLGKEVCRFLHTSEINGMGFATVSGKAQKKEAQPRYFLIDNLGEWVVSGQMELLMSFVQNQQPECKYIMAGRIQLPPQLLPYKLTSQITIYGKNRLRYSEKELNSICAYSYEGHREQIRSLYELCHGMPLFMAVTEGLLEGEATNDKSTPSQ